MSHQWLRAWLYRIASVIDVITFIAIGIVLGALRWDPAKTPGLPGWISTALLWCQSFGAVLLIVLFVVSYAGRAVKHFIRPPYLQKQLKALLDSLQKELFQAERLNGEPPHLHRVTLFREGWAWRFRRWPWSGWLCPVERSGLLTRKGGSYFRISDDPNVVEGVAGQVWLRQATVIIQDLPDLDAEMDPDLHKRSVEEYAKRTYVTVPWIQKRLKAKRPMARSFIGMPVEVNGTMQAVLVIDSRSPKAKAKGAKLDHVRFFVGMLGKVLGG